MIYQKFIPEGWKNKEIKYTKEELISAFENGTILESKMDKYNKNGIYINLGLNQLGIIPKDELGRYNKNNKYVQFKITDIKNNIFILSRKLAQEDSLNWAINELKIGQRINGIVRNIKTYGAFVDIGSGTSGLIHIEDISKARMKSPEERLKVGQKIPIIVKEINKQERKVNLSYKEILGTWEENIKDIEEGKTVKGIVREISKDKKGIFIEIKPNLVGMIEYQDNLEYGQEINVYVKRIIKDKQKIKLVIK